MAVTQDSLLTHQGDLKKTMTNEAKKENASSRRFAFCGRPSAGDNKRRTLPHACVAALIFVVGISLKRLRDERIAVVDDYYLFDSKFDEVAEMSALAKASSRRIQRACVGLPNQRNQQLRHEMWSGLCEIGFVEQMESYVVGAQMEEMKNRRKVGEGAKTSTNQKSSPPSSSPLTIIQIGAHTGWNLNDPIMRGLTNYLKDLHRDYQDHDNERNNTTTKPPNTSVTLGKDRISYVLVEASPPTFAKLQENVRRHSQTVACNMTALHLGVVPSSPTSPSANNNTGTHTSNSNSTTQNGEKSLIFYSMRDTIDRETGYDSLSGSKLLHWVSQLSSFSKDIILYQNRYFQSLGLNIEDYIVETKVPTITFQELLRTYRPLLVLVDTEGLDCDLLLSLSLPKNNSDPSMQYLDKDHNQFLPPNLIFENKYCRDHLTNVMDHLASLGYNTSLPHYDDNTLVYQNQYIS